MNVGFISSGQKIRVKLTSYQFQKYGMIDARVDRVSADASEKKEGADPAPSLTYKTLLTLE